MYNENNWTTKQLPPYQAFHNKLWKINLLKESILTTRSLSVVVWRKSLPWSQWDFPKYHYWNREPSLLAETFQPERKAVIQRLRRYNTIESVLTLEAMQKIIEFYQNKGVDLLKFWCSIRNLANIGLLSSITAKIYPFGESDKDLLLKVWEDIVGGQSIVITRKAVVDKTHICKFSNVCKATLGIDVIQIYPYSTSQPMPTRLNTKNEFDADFQRFKHRQKKSRSSVVFVIACVQQMKADCKIETFCRAETQRQINFFIADGFCGFYNTDFEAGGCFYHYY